MPKMIPDIDPVSIGNDGEQAVYMALKEQLPPGWTVRYDFHFCRKRGSKIAPDGQVDFVVIIPDQGLLFLEVKGIRDATFFADGGQCYWRQKNGARMKTDNPFVQASGNMHDLVKVLREDLGFGEYFPGRYGHAVVFPFVDGYGQLPTSSEPQVVWTFAQMAGLGNACEQAILCFGSQINAGQFTGDIERRVCSWFRDRVELAPVAAVDAVVGERTIKALTLQQYDAVAGVLDNKRVRVEGVAGSGKTLVALWTAMQLAESGKRVLLLCFNKALAVWLDEQLRASGARVETFHGFASNLCRKAEVVCQGDADDPRYWSDVVPIQLMEAIEKRPDLAGYDVVLIDEAQDFHPNWWVAVEMLKTDSGQLHYFLDPEQADMYGQEQAFLKSDVTYKLRKNCRNTVRIASTSGQALGKKVESMAGMPEGQKPRVLNTIGSTGERRTRIQGVVGELLHQGYEGKDIAVLSPWSLDNSKCSLGGMSAIHGNAITQDPRQWQKKNHIWGSTIRAFKGLEARVVLLVDLPPLYPPAFTQTDLYVAMTRAKHELICIPMSEESKRLLEGLVAGLSGQ